MVLSEINSPPPVRRHLLSKIQDVLRQNYKADDSTSGRDAEE